jgi:hypothetical protein
MELLHHEVPTCEECCKWIYDPKTWKKAERPAGTPTPRPKGTMPSCHACPKSGEVSRPRPDRDLTEESRAIYEYYLLCQADATGLLPRDLLVVENNAWVHRVLGMIERARPDQGMMMMLGMLARGK